MEKDFVGKQSVHEVISAVNNLAEAVRDLSRSIDRMISAKEFWLHKTIKDDKPEIDNPLYSMQENFSVLKKNISDTLALIQTDECGFTDKIVAVEDNSADEEFSVTADKVDSHRISDGDAEISANCILDTEVSGIHIGEYLKRLSEKHGFSIVNVGGQDTDGSFWSSLALLLAKNNSRLIPLLQALKSAQSNPGKKGSLSLAKLNSDIASSCISFCNMLHRYALLEECHLFKSSQVIRFKIPANGDVINFITGKWLEIFVFNTVCALISNFEKMYDIQTEKYLNIQIMLSPLEQFELDIMFFINGVPVWIECKSGTYQNRLFKYKNLASKFDIRPENMFLICSQISVAEAEKLTSLHKYRVINLDNFRQVISTAIASICMSVAKRKTDSSFFSDSNNLAKTAEIFSDSVNIENLKKIKEDFGNVRVTSEMNNSTQIKTQGKAQNQVLATDINIRNLASEQANVHRQRVEKAIVSTFNNSDLCKEHLKSAGIIIISEEILSVQDFDLITLANIVMKNQPACLKLLSEINSQMQREGGMVYVNTVSEIPLFVPTLCNVCKQMENMKLISDYHYSRTAGTISFRVIAENILNKFIGERKWFDYALYSSVYKYLLNKDNNYAVSRNVILQYLGNTYRINMAVSVFDLHLLVVMGEGNIEKQAKDLSVIGRAMNIRADELFLVSQTLLPEEAETLSERYGIRAVSFDGYDNAIVTVLKDRAQVEYFSHVLSNTGKENDDPKSHFSPTPAEIWTEPLSYADRILSSYMSAVKGVAFGHTCEDDNDNDQTSVNIASFGFTLTEICSELSQKSVNDAQICFLGYNKKLALMDSASLNISRNQTRFDDVFRQINRAQRNGYSELNISLKKFKADEVSSVCQVMENFCKLEWIDGYKYTRGVERIMTIKLLPDVMLPAFMNEGWMDHCVCYLAQKQLMNYVREGGNPAFKVCRYLNIGSGNDEKSSRIVSLLVKHKKGITLFGYSHSNLVANAEKMYEIGRILGSYYTGPSDVILVNFGTDPIQERSLQVLMNIRIVNFVDYRNSLSDIIPREVCMDNFDEKAQDISSDDCGMYGGQLLPEKLYGNVNASQETIVPDRNESSGNFDYGCTPVEHGDGDFNVRLNQTHYMSLDETSELIDDENIVVLNREYYTLHTMIMDELSERIYNCIRQHDVNGINVINSIIDAIDNGAKKVVLPEAFSRQDEINQTYFVERLSQTCFLSKVNKCQSDSRYTVKFLFNYIKHLREYLQSGWFKYFCCKTVTDYMNSMVKDGNNKLYYRLAKNVCLLCNEIKINIDLVLVTEYHTVYCSFMKDELENNLADLTLLKAQKNLNAEDVLLVRFNCDSEQNERISAEKGITVIGIDELKDYLSTVILNPDDSSDYDGSEKLKDNYDGLIEKYGYCRDLAMYLKDCQ